MKSKRVLTELPIATADGEFIAGYSRKGLAALAFPGSAGIPAGELARSNLNLAGQDTGAPRIRRWHRLTVAALKQTLAGRSAEHLPPLDLSAGTEFQKSVWAAMQRIPAGRTCSYGELAKSIGKPKAVRAVGGACGANPIPVLVPCHRVLAANKQIGGFGGGLDWKRTLLVREGVSVS